MNHAMLSIDFDFFSREDPVWDWGHSEPDDEEEESGNIFASGIWGAARYGTVDPRTGDYLDLWEATDPKHAGLLPTELMDYIVEAGFDWDAERAAMLTLADSHRHGLSAYMHAGMPDHIISFDAHHDVYGKRTDRKLHCGNWLVHAIRKNSALRVTVVYPQWRTEFEDAELPKWAQRHVTTVLFNDWDPEPMMLDGVFLCRSPVWLPPHHDAAFVELAHELIEEFGEAHVPTNMARRSFPGPEDALAVYRERVAAHELLNQARVGA